MATPNVLETRAGSGLRARTQIITMPTADQAAMDAQIAELGLTHTIGGVDGTAGGTVAIALQGTADAPATVNSGVAVTVAHDFAE